MSWQILISLSVLLFSINSLLHRKLLKNENTDPYAQTILFTFLVGVFSVALIAFNGRQLSILRWEQLPLFLAIALISPLVFIFMFKGYKHVGASEHAVLLTSSRGWTIIGAVFFLRETPTVTKLAGALLIVAGVVLTQWKKNKMTINFGAAYVLLAAFFIGAAGTLAYVLLRDFDALTFMVYNSFTVSILLLLLKPTAIKKLSMYSNMSNLINVLISSFNDSLANIFTFLAYQLGRNALQIGPLGALQVPLTVVLASVFLGERDHMAQKIVGTLTALVGTMLIVL